MVNSTSVQLNITRVSFYREQVDDITRTVLVIFTVLCFIFFLYFITVLLNGFFTSPYIRENARYVLFAHMLINDTLYLALTIFIVATIMYTIYFPMPICYIMLTLAASSFRVTPYNLAVMSLERYIAICFPLRHLQFCTAGRAKSAIVMVWVIGFAPSIADFTAVIYSTEKMFSSFNVLCNHSMLVISPIQNMIRSFIHILSFTMVAIIILFTYIKVLLVARRVGSGGSTAFKAGKTVMLHAFQLMLCMVSFISSLTETYFPNYIASLVISNFLVFTCLPRFLSPLIYGIRDEAFRRYIRKLYSPNFKELLQLNGLIK